MKHYPARYWVSNGGRGEPKQVGRVTPWAPLCPPISRRARSDAPYPPSLTHYYLVNGFLKGRCAGRAGPSGKEEADTPPKAVGASAAGRVASSAEGFPASRSA